MRGWNPSPDDDDDADDVYGMYNHRTFASPRSSSSSPQPQTTPNGPSAGQHKETLKSPGAPSIFTLGHFKADDNDDVVTFGPLSSQPDPRDISFSLSKPEATRRTIEKSADGKDFIISRRGERPHTPFGSRGGGQRLDGDEHVVKRHSRGFNFPNGVSPASRSQSTSHVRTGSGESDKNCFTSLSHGPNTVSVPPQNQNNRDANVRGAIRRISAQGKVDVLAARGRNRSLQSNAINDAPLQYGDDLETTHF